MLNLIRSLKACTKCLVPQPTIAFSRQAKSRTGYAPNCKRCHQGFPSASLERRREAARRRPPRALSPEARQKMLLKMRYGITPETYATILAAQGGRCAICRTESSDGSGRRFHIDHCHATGMIRGLLCSGCNTGIGQLGDSVELLRSAIEYLTTADTGVVATGNAASRSRPKRFPAQGARPRP